MRKPLVAALFVFALTLNLAAANSAQPVQPTPPPTLLAQQIRAGTVPGDIATLTVRYDALVSEIGEQETSAGVRARNGLTADEMDVLEKWMADVRIAVRRAEEVRRIRDHHITCMRALRPCWREFEPEGIWRGQGLGAVEP